MSRRRLRAAGGSLAFLVLVPGVVAGLIPWWLTPTARLVVGGLYRHVRNPMYLAAAAAVVGQALVLGRPVLGLYTLAFAAAVAAFVHGYEEPTLAARYGSDYERYRAAVPAWLPRRTAWRDDDGTRPAVVGSSGGSSAS